MKIRAEVLTEDTKEILTKLGVPEDAAQTVAEELVRSNLMGVDSHGVLRIPRYVKQIQDGFIKPDANVKVVKESPSTAIIDADCGFGHVAARKMAQVVCEKAAKTGIACALSMNSTHIGRAGAYTEWIARQGMIGFAVAAVYTQGPLAPYGAAEGKLGTNPISWAVPRYGADPVIMDGATTIAAERKLRAYIQKGMQVPEGWIRDGHGNNTTNPEDFYKEPKGTILPIGGLNAGAAKGSALSIMCDMFSIALANDDYWTALKEGGKLKAENGFFLMAVNPEFFCGTLAYEKQVDNHARFIKDAKPAEGFDEVLLPGEFEFRQAKKKEQEGIDLPEETWNGLVSIGQKLGCKWSAGLETVKAKEFVQF